MIFTHIYGACVSLCKPIIKWHLKKRVIKGKEHPERYIEKMGLPTVIRPKREVIWIHAVSVGESISALPLVEKYIQKGKIVLITTTTTTSAQIMAERLPDGAIHQFFPLDVEHWIFRFLEYWKPSKILWLESELWPTMLYSIKKKNIPLYLVNARFSEKTQKRLKYWGFIAKEFLSNFTKIFVQNEIYISIIEKLTGNKPLYLGNLKYSSTIAIPEQISIDNFKNTFKNRPVWACISTHAEDEKFIQPAVKELHKNIPDLLTIIVPRHPERMPNIYGFVKKLNYKVRSRREDITEKTNVYIADTIGEMALFLKCVNVCFIGGSTGGGYGGHNPLEPASLDCAIIQGMDTNHFTGICQSLNQKKAQVQVNNPDELYNTVTELLKNNCKRNLLIKGSKSVAKENKDIADKIINNIENDTANV